MTDFETLTRALADAGVEFVVVGGVAATVHGSARLTSDLDVVYSREPSNISRLVRALAPYGPYLRGAPRGLPFMFDEETVRGGLNFTLTTRVGDIDLLGEIAGGGRFGDLLPHCIRIQLFGRTCLCLDLPWLIKTKRAAGRPRDIEVVAELECILDESGGQTFES